MNKIRKHLYLNEDSCEYIIKYKEKYNIRSESETIEKIIEENKRKSDITNEFLIDMIVEKVSNNVKASLTPLKKAINTSDKNSKIILELLNGKFIKEEVGLIFSIDEKKSPALEKAERVINEKIVSQRTSKLDKEY
ncbi:hypothetical protein [Clostridium baratii]|uniref:Uncharacterized protein n=1 Tax=Clostridium baratii TaxID=1561 RepID=A0A174VE89_9CLOT|nr:hypothetical protein [Clostridium baratii]CUQ30310.1 Uncharacterised protein [Clostridium baratii]